MGCFRGLSNSIRKFFGRLFHKRNKVSPMSSSESLDELDEELDKFVTDELQKISTSMLAEGTTESAELDKEVDKFVKEELKKISTSMLAEGTTDSAD